MRKLWWVLTAVCVVVGASLALAVALPGDIVLPDGATSSPVPTLTTSNWLDPAFSYRAGIIVLGAVAVMAAIALVARAMERRRER